ncbi:MAG: VCBS repeat-containing protein [Pirellulaceae bacterium]
MSWGLFMSRDDKAMRELESRLEKMLESSHWEQVPIPDELLTSAWLEERQQRELETADTLQARHDFQFADRRAESGIDFLSRGVFDMTREYRSNHYDHACGLAVADYDNDGWPDIYFVNKSGPTNCGTATPAMGRLKTSHPSKRGWPPAEQSVSRRRSPIPTTMATPTCSSPPRDMAMSIS